MSREEVIIEVNPETEPSLLAAIDGVKEAGYDMTAARSWVYRNNVKVTVIIVSCSNEPSAWMKLGMLHGENILKAQKAQTNKP